MNSMNLGSPIVVMVVGIPGSGKSFFARRFAETFGAPLISEDKIRYTLFSNHTYESNEQAMVDQVAELLLDELLVTGKTFVIDGGYATKISRVEFEKIASQNGYKTLVVWVQTDDPTARRRATHRSDDNPGDQFKSSMTDNQFDTVSKTFTPPANTDKVKNVVVISGKHTYASQAKMVLKKIVEAREDLQNPNKAVNRGDTPSRGIFIR